MLIELLMATVVSVIGLLTILTGVVQSAKLRRIDEETSIAFAACRETLDEIRNIPISQLPTLTGVGFDVLAVDGSPGGLNCLPEDDDGLPGVIDVVVDQSGGGSTIYRVTATVAWIGIRGRQKFYLDTLVGERSQ